MIWVLKIFTLDLFPFPGTHNNVKTRQLQIKVKNPA